MSDDQKITAELAMRLRVEIRALREGFVGDEIDGQRIAFQGDLTREATDQIEAASRITWARSWPALDSLLMGISVHMSLVGGSE